MAEAEIIAAYRSAFPDWEISALDATFYLTRSQGPFTQIVAFEALDGGASYNIRCAVDVDIADISGRRIGTILERFLAKRELKVSVANHLEVWSQVVRLLEEQVSPSIRAPLHLPEVVELADQEFAERSYVHATEIETIIALNALVGCVERVLYWCLRGIDKLEDTTRQPDRYERKSAQRLRALYEELTGSELPARKRPSARKTITGDWHQLFPRWVCIGRCGSRAVSARWYRASASTATPRIKRISRRRISTAFARPRTS